MSNEAEEFMGVELLEGAVDEAMVVAYALGLQSIGD